MNHIPSSINRMLGLLLLCGSCGCAASMVYSPTLNLPSHALRQGQGQALADYGLLPETRPANAGAVAVPGLGLGIRFATSNSFALGVKWWGTFSQHYSNDSDLHLRSGVAAEAIIPLSLSGASYRTAIVPRFGFVFDGNSMQGFGTTISIAYWLPGTGGLSPYAAIGPLLGLYNNFDPPLRYGYGLVGNLGTSLEIIEHLTLHAEVAGIVQVNQAESITHGILAPSLGIDWGF
ncbi:MAG: hypothetical protein JST22_18335 [Bacteroidetes bacterium]|nr:hypothetical protein [Bacteroidota bacterium]